MSDAKSAAERLLESREFCTGWPHPTTNPMRYMFATADVFAVANRCLELELEVNKLNTECGHLSADKAELEAENAKRSSMLRAAMHLFLGSDAIYDPRGDTGPTHWLQTRDRWIAEARKVVRDE